MLNEHLGYLGDSVRLAAYREAIARAVRPGDRVVDLGCGTGVLGLMCLQAGAGFVTAIDSTPMIEVARESFMRSGFGERVDCIAGWSTQVSLAQRADLVVCDQIGHFGFDYGIATQYEDARARFLLPGGRLMPEALDLFVGAVECESHYRRLVGWDDPQVPGEFHWLRLHAANTRHAVEFDPAHLIAPPMALASLELGAPVPSFLHWKRSLTASRDGWMHGVAGWFQARLAAGVGMTNDPSAPDRIDRPQAFLPLQSPVPLREGDRVEVAVMARPHEDILAWSVSTPRSGAKAVQSTWLGEGVLPRALRVLQTGARPVATPNAAAHAIVLGYCDGSRTAEEVVQIVLKRHTDLMPTAAELSRFVMRVIARHCA